MSISFEDASKWDALYSIVTDFYGRSIVLDNQSETVLGEITEDDEVEMTDGIFFQKVAEILQESAFKRN